MRMLKAHEIHPTMWRRKKDYAPPGWKDPTPEEITQRCEALHAEYAAQDKEQREAEQQIPVVIHCRLCNAELRASQAEATRQGWADFMREKQESRFVYTWCDFSATCPACE